MSQEEDNLERKSRVVELIEKLSERVEANAEAASRRDDATQRNIDFIIKQQAQFTADMQQMRESQAEADRRWEQRWGRTEESIRSLLTLAEIHEREINVLLESQARLAEAQAQTDRQIRESQAQTDRQMAETDKRLNALINTVERINSERRNGGGRAAEGEGPRGEGQR